MFFLIARGWTCGISQVAFGGPISVLWMEKKHLVYRTVAKFPQCPLFLYGSALCYHFLSDRYTTKQNGAVEKKIAGQNWLELRFDKF